MQENNRGYPLGNDLKINYKLDLPNTINIVDKFTYEILMFMVLTIITK